MRARQYSDYYICSGFDSLWCINRKVHATKRIDLDGDQIPHWEISSMRSCDGSCRGKRISRVVRRVHGHNFKRALKHFLKHGSLPGWCRYL